MKATEKKTYYVKGLMEWQLELPTGSLTNPFITIPFEGGQISGYGVAPARFTTDDLFLQTLIEKSKWFIENKIVVGKTEPLKK